MELFLVDGNFTTSSGRPWDRRKGLEYHNKFVIYFNLILILIKFN